MKDFTHILEKQLQDITKELQAIGIHNPQVKEDWIATPPAVDQHEPDSDLTADIAEEWEERAALVATLEHEYNDIVRALEKIKTETYGTCEICHAHIEEERLEALPTARTCTTHMAEEDLLAL